ncbi:MAG: 3-methyl-2-oxobutanoate hydroxymethyltransferase [Methylophilaceae bacterium]|nr:3-methyl-2-oxobutanoate hydroxymethyltransferase [Methylophilaceae bacterium]
MLTNLQDLNEMAKRGEKIAMLTCYDATFAKLMEQAEVDALLVGDSLGMVLQGHTDTLTVTLDDMCYHTACVARGAPHGMIITDMPVGTFEHDASVALANARVLMAAGAKMVKIEGAFPHIVQHMVAHGITVCGHLGFTPQSVKTLGGYKVQGNTPESAAKMLRDALDLQAAGMQMLVLEMVPAGLAASITKALAIPTIGIGAGVACSGQVLVLQDLLGIYSGSPNHVNFRLPRFVRNFMTQSGSIEAAVRAFVTAVKKTEFPASVHSYQ